MRKLLLKLRRKTRIWISFKCQGLKFSSRLSHLTVYILQSHCHMLVLRNDMKRLGLTFLRYNIFPNNGNQIFLVEKLVDLQGTQNAKRKETQKHNKNIYNFAPLHPSGILEVTQESLLEVFKQSYLFIKCLICKTSNIVILEHDNMSSNML